MSAFCTQLISRIGICVASAALTGLVLLVPVYYSYAS